MGLSESSSNTITKPLSFYHIVRLVVVRHVVLKYLAMKRTIASVMLTHMNI